MPVILIFLCRQSINANDAKYIERVTWMTLNSFVILNDRVFCPPPPPHPPTKTARVFFFGIFFRSLGELRVTFDIESNWSKIQKIFHDGTMMAMHRFSDYAMDRHRSDDDATTSIFKIALTGRTVVSCFSCFLSKTMISDEARQSAPLRARHSQKTDQHKQQQQTSC
jgi:hypothetical protein